MGKLPNALANGFHVAATRVSVYITFTRPEVKPRGFGLKRCGESRERIRPMSDGTKELRLKLELSQTAAAAIAEVSPHTWKLYEIDPALLTPKKRERCDLARAKIAKLAQDRSAA